ncbi:MAG: phosphate signaling complex protein PhoU [Cytophagaceae bacterium]|jgi:phosphate transport system protein|nr:phosphate signaling complex protein PhoU [Cytophagaceae bacterium]
MKHTEREMQSLKEEVRQMWKLVISQLEKAKQSFMAGNAELALEIASREKRVDAFELKIDSDCENYIALYSPVAVDLRLALSLIKISSTLERIGDFAAGIARHVIDGDCHKVDEKLMEDLQIEKMFDTLIGMLSDGFVALESENTKISGKILAKDEEVDAIYHSAIDVLTNYIVENGKLKVENDNNNFQLSTFNFQLEERVRCGLKLLLVIRKLERIGDHCSNIVEEIVFYVDAKVLKHRKDE